MILKLFKKVLGIGRKQREKKAQKRMRRFFRRVIGSALTLGLAAGGTYMAYTHRKELCASLLDKVMPEGKIKDKLAARLA